MKRIDSLAREFASEAKTTRRHLERLSDDKLTWKPHPKSYTTGGLAAHLVDCIRWTESIFTVEELDLDPATYETCKAASVAELLATFDTDVARCSQVLDAVREEDLDKPWRLKLKGRLIVDRSKAEAFRGFTLSHLIHHRGQLSVYLRLLDLPVPGSYGPTADEAF